MPTVARLHGIAVRMYVRDDPPPYFHAVCRELRFADGSEGVHDFAGLVNEPGSLLEPLRDVDYFARVVLE
jgi:hypothetical protein